MIQYKYKIGYIALLLFFVSCYPKGDKYIGKVTVEGLDNIYFNIYQEYPHDLEPGLAIDYEIVSDNKILSSRSFLSGSHSGDFPVQINDYFTGVYDDIIYLSYGDKNRVCAIYDLKTNSGYPKGISMSEDSKSIFNRADSLFSILQGFNLDLMRK